MRPVSVTSVMSRVFERLIYQNYLQGPYNRWLTRNQYGFRKHSSTSCMLIRLQHHLWNFRENYDYVRFFSLDMSKAFDTIYHKSVIEGVMNIVPVVDPAVVNVIINFLQKRAHYTSLNGLDSTVLYTNQGVPQGTVLGPPLYNCSTHAIDVSDISTTLSTYADENNPLVSGCNSADNAREVISSLCHEFDARNLFLNVQKSSNEMSINFNYSGSNAIHMVVGNEVVDDLKVLGFTIDSKFGFSKNIDKAVKQSNSILFFSIWRLGKIGYSKHELAILYRAYILPKLYYGINVWGGSNVKDLEMINLFQRRAIRLGVTDTYEPISATIRRADQKLYDAILQTGSDHLLLNLVPTRSTYSANNLRCRDPPIARCKMERQMKIFPYHLLRRLHDI